MPRRLLVQVNHSSQLTVSKQQGKFIIGTNHIGPSPHFASEQYPLTTLAKG